MSVIAAIPNVLLVNPKVPAKSVAEFIAYAKANPGKLISAGVAEALRNGDVQARLAALSAEPMGLSASDTAAYMKQETERWANVIRATNVKLD